jgi:hypothetical protein
VGVFGHGGVLNIGRYCMDILVFGLERAGSGRKIGPCTPWHEESRTTLHLNSMVSICSLQLSL